MLYLIYLVRVSELIMQKKYADELEINEQINAEFNEKPNDSEYFFFKSSFDVQTNIPRCPLLSTGFVRTGKVISNASISLIEDILYRFETEMP